MVRTFTNLKGHLREFVSLLVFVLSFAVTASAQNFAEGDKLESDDISAAILAEGSVPVKWTNDAEHPWYLVGSGENTYIRTPEKSGDCLFTSTLSFTYSSKYPTELTCDWRKYEYHSGDILKFIVDGEEKASTKSSSWSNLRFVIPAGSHTVEFKSISAGTYYPSNNYYGGLRKIRVWEIKELESACLKEGSLPLHFENDPENMWITENGYIRSTIENLRESTTKISTTFDIDKTSVFSLEFSMGYRNYEYSVAKIYVDGVQYKNTNDWSFSSGVWQYVSLALYPGTHKVEIAYYNDYTHKDNWTRVRNVCLDQTWYNATLNNPGELGVRLLQALGDKNLQDAELVKIKGTMNSDDWAVIKQLTGVKAIDLTETDIASVPNEGFKDVRLLSTVMLPNTVKEIGNDAFQGTNFRQITIPASVERIGHESWRDTPIQYINFEENSKLSTIGYAAFYR
ncbi:MAG: leucine-rich repeat domain-containing protein, partial [Muribaculaceae bacterium]|nr:leucine-rich repeat domain-containing protein [Muribaculaceae bacterium]